MTVQVLVRTYESEGTYADSSVIGVYAGENALDISQSKMKEEYESELSDYLDGFTLDTNPCLEKVIDAECTGIHEFSANIRGSLSGSTCGRNARWRIEELEVYQA